MNYVFHGQYNPDHSFNYIEKLDWLVEGIATFVSGQLDANRSQRLKQLINENKVPSTLDIFGKDKKSMDYQVPWSPILIINMAGIHYLNS